ncbi:ABC transporter substrate-binding protein [Nocardioides sp. LHG3406-4]|uniref:ABC transporter substrate-binding protein n=1 Tax=Nocardioides sp. LHG3406-4 TaxID=2804575 RepID=UPI003CEA887E
MSRRLSRRFSFSVVAVGLTLLLAACGSSGEGDDESAGGGTDLGEVRLGLVCGGVTPLIPQVAMAAKTFPEGLSVKSTCFDGGSEMVQALIGGSVDVVIGSIEYPLSLRAQDLDLKAYAVLENRMPYVLVAPPDSTVDSIDDLEGEKVGITSPGSLSDTELKKAAADAGVAYDSMQVLGVGAGTTAIAALQQGQVAAGMVLQPTLADLLDKGYTTVWSPDFSFLSITALAKPDWASDHEATMKGFLEGLSTAYDKSEADAGFAVDAMSDSDFAVSDDVLADAVSFTLDMVPPGLTVEEKDYQSTTDVLVDLGLYKESDILPFDEALDFGLLPSK